MAGEEAEALLEQCRRVVRELNCDDALIQQATGIMEDAESIVGDQHTRSEVCQAQARETWVETIREIECCKTFASFGSLVAPVDGCAPLAILQPLLRGGAVLGVAARNAAPRFLSRRVVFCVIAWCSPRGAG